MKKIVVICLISLVLASGCSNMSRQQQATLSGSAMGAAAGAGIAVIAGGAVGWGALAGAGAGALAGAVLSQENEREW